MSAAVFDCTVRLTVTVHKSHPAEITASGILISRDTIKESENGAETVTKHYLLTAYHNFHDAKTCKARGDLTNSTGVVTIFNPDAMDSEKSHANDSLGTKIFLDVARDLAIIEVKDLKAFDRARGQKFLSLHPPRSAISLGRSAAAFALPAVNGGGYGLGVRTAVAYHCTVSRDGQFGELLSPNDVLRVDYNSSIPSEEKNGSIRDRVYGTRFLIVETLSVTHGFSGTGLVVSTDGFIDTKNADIAGIVIGGSGPGQFEGRWALVLSSQEIDTAIGEMERPAQTHAAGQFIVDRESFSGDWLPDPIMDKSFSTDQRITVSPNAFRERPLAVRLQSFGLHIDEAQTSKGVDGLMFLPNGNVAVCETFIRQITEDFPGAEIHFENCEFNPGCLSRLILIGASFRNCVFHGTTFQHSVLSGAYFNNGCQFLDGARDNLRLAWPHGVRHQHDFEPRLNPIKQR